MPTSTYHIVRNGQPVGQFDPEEIESKLQDGSLVLDDRVFLDAERKWVSLSEWRERIIDDENIEEDAPPVSQDSQPQNLPISGKDGKPLTVHTDFGIPRAPKSTDRKHPSKRHRERRHRLSGDDFTDGKDDTTPQESNYRKRRKKTRFEQSLYGYIFVAVALLVAAMSFNWGNGYRNRVKGLNEEIKSLKEQLKTRDDQNRSLVQPVPAGQIAGTVGIEDPVNKQFAPIASAAVTLLRRTDTEKFLENHPHLSNLSSVTQEELGTIISDFRSSLPKPAATTLTNTDGAFRFTVSDPADYVLLVLANKTIEGEQAVWLQGVRTGSPSQRLILTDREAFSADKFHFKITPPPGTTQW